MGDNFNTGHSITNDCSTPTWIVSYQYIVQTSHQLDTASEGLAAIIAWTTGLKVLGVIINKCESRGFFFRGVVVQSGAYK